MERVTSLPTQAFTGCSHAPRGLCLGVGGTCLLLTQGHRCPSSPSSALYCPDLPRTPLPGTLAWSSAVCPLVSCRLCLHWKALLPPPPQRGPCSPLGYSLPQSALIPSPAVLSLSELSSAERLPCVYWFIISLPKLPHKVEVSCFPTTPLGLE